MSQENDTNATVVIDIEKALEATDKEASQKSACLVVVGGDLNGTIFDLPDGNHNVGRSAELEIQLDFQGISRKHFCLTVSQDMVKITDLGSSNGTYLNNAKVEGSLALRKADIIKVGAVALKYLPKGDPERLTYDKLHEEANTDGLTKCYNKTYFNNAMDLEVKKSKVTGVPLTLVLFDLDHFKGLNDNYGHDAGDYVLAELSNIIREHGIREGDIFARYGGEEFVIILPLTNLKQAFQISERLRKLIEEHDFIYDNQKLPVTASIGLADYRQGVANGTDLFKRADEAVYKSKRNGRNQVNFYRNE